MTAEMTAPGNAAPGGTDPTDGTDTIDPFSAGTIAATRTRLLSTEAARAAQADAIASLREHGHVTLPRVLDAAELSTIRRALDTIHEHVAPGTNAFAGFDTRRAFNLVARTRALDGLITHPDVLAVVEGLLDDQIQLSIASTIDLGPGSTAQPLHRDDGYYPIPHAGLPLSVNVMWAIDDFTADNGATVYVPGSHTWDPERRAEPSERRVAEMPAGSAFLWQGGLLHGGGRNGTDRRRLGLTVLYCRAWLRQQENQYLGLDPDVVARFDRPFQRLLGYAMFGATLGNVDGVDPKHWLERRRAPLPSPR